MPKCDRWIREMAAKGMIAPFVETLKADGIISAGVGSYGYDMRVSDEFRVPNPDAVAAGHVLDPKGADPAMFLDTRAQVCVIPSGSYVLGKSVERFRIPRDVLAICFGKSTYARAGVVVNVTPLEPEWEGHVTISIANTSPFPVRVYAGEGIAQVLFLDASEVCETSYADRSGKYQNSNSITLAKT